jgi:hypothetical protein
VKKVRCASFIPGGIQCTLQMYHTDAHVYEPYKSFSTHLEVEEMETRHDSQRNENRLLRSLQRDRNDSNKAS